MLRDEEMNKCTCQSCWDRSIKLSFGIFTSKAGVEDGLTSQIDSDEYIAKIKQIYGGVNDECLKK